MGFCFPSVVRCDVTRMSGIAKAPLAGVMFCRASGNTNRRYSCAITAGGVFRLSCRFIQAARVGASLQDSGEAKAKNLAEAVCDTNGD